MKFHLTSLGFYGINSDNRVTKSSCLDLEQGLNFRLFRRFKVHVLRALEINGSLFASPSLTDFWSLVSFTQEILKNHFIQYNYVTII